jgi:hypothetical protein
VRRLLWPKEFLALPRMNQRRTCLSHRKRAFFDGKTGSVRNIFVMVLGNAANLRVVVATVVSLGAAAAGCIRTRWKKSNVTSFCRLMRSSC